MDPRNPDLRPGSELHGYRLERSVELAEISAVYHQLTHLETGARHVHISRADAENTFSVAFKTVPADSTGVAHILEHTVLCGSRRFPVRDPFFSMLKRSLNTFMNAFTASDWTMYPFSTQNRKDLYNLMDVYLDAAFFPRLDGLSFKQEGHRMEVVSTEGGDRGSRLGYHGVVYNEMKGAMSSPDQVMARSLLNALYPDTTYRFNSGGDPAQIPRLTHDQLTAFHRRHYHPSNAFFYTYGDQPLGDHLAEIAEKVLTGFTRIDPGTEVSSQPRWDGPRTATYRYPLAESEDPARQYQACVAWLTGDIRDSFEVLVQSVLEHILLGNAASPLRKALIDSRLGSALSDSTGFDADNRDTLFACGLKQVGEDDGPRVEKIVMDTLADLASGGIDPGLAESAIHQIEFHRREVVNTPYPYGLRLLLSFAGSWLHGGDPVRSLQLDADLERLREEMAAGGFLEGRIRRLYLENPHRVRLTLAPDQGMAAVEARRVAGELAEKGATMSPRDLERLTADADALVRLQETVEEIDCLPTLALEDIPPDVERIQPSAAPAGVAAAAYPRETSGIFYLAGAAGLNGLDAGRLPLLPFFCFALPRTGTRRRSYEEMARRIDTYTGGISVSANARSAFVPDGGCRPFVALNAKCLDRNQEALFDIMGELTTAFDFSDRERLRDLLREYRAGMEAMVVQNGHRLAISLAARAFTPAAGLAEAWSGVHQLKTVKKLTDDLDDRRLGRLAEDLAEIGRTIFGAGNLQAALIGGRDTLESGLRETDRLGGVAGEGAFAVPLALPAADEPPREGWTTATAVSFVASVFPTVRLPDADAPRLAVIGKMLRSLFLHREIREKGGAYGGFSLYNPEDGLFSFGSYRDPRLAATLETYDQASEFIRTGDYGREDVTEAVLQVCSEIDRPDPPGPAARKAFYRRILGLTDEMRADYKRRLLAVGPDDVRAAAMRHFGPGAPGRAVAVISNREKLEAENPQVPGGPLTLHSI